MSEQNIKANHAQEGKSCDQIDDFQSEPGEKFLSPKSDQNDGGKFCESQNETDNNFSDVRRDSQCSCGTENSILLSNYDSMQGLQTFDDENAQGYDQIHKNVLGADFKERKTSDSAEVETNMEVLRDFDPICTKPFLNGHSRAPVGEEDILVEKPREVMSGRHSNLSTRIGRRMRSFFDTSRPRSHTAPVQFSKTNGASVVITIEDEVKCAPRSDTSFRRFKEWLQPMDNKLNIKVFGSRKAMDEEMLRYKTAGWIIHPMSAFRLEILFRSVISFPLRIVCGQNSVTVLCLSKKRKYCHQLTFCEENSRSSPL